MGNQETKEALRALSQEKESRSNTARLRDFLGEIEAALANGVRHQTILATLQKHGFTFQLRGFQTALYRLQKKKALAQASKTSPGASPGPTQTTPTGPRVASTPSLPITKESQQEKEKAEADYQAFLESIKHLPPREQHKKEGIYWTTRPHPLPR